jgi:hypothetical protein
VDRRRPITVEDKKRTRRTANDPCLTRHPAGGVSVLDTGGQPSSIYAGGGKGGEPTGRKPSLYPTRSGQVAMPELPSLNQTYVLDVDAAV